MELLAVEVFVVNCKILYEEVATKSDPPDYKYN